MLVQLFILIIALWGANYYRYSPHSDNNGFLQRKKYITLLMVLCALQSGLRNVGVGADTITYYYMFEEAGNSPWSFLISTFNDFVHGGDYKDPGFSLLVKLFYSVIPSYRVFLLFVGSFFFYSLGRLLLKYLKNNEEIMVSIALYQCLYYSFFSITGIRQTLATAILLFALPLVLEKKTYKFVLLVLLAATQHKSALLFLLFYLLRYIPKEQKVMIASIAIFFVMYASGGAIISSLIGGTIFEQYSNFLEQNEIAGAYTFAAYMVMLILCLIWNHPYIANLENDIENRLFYNTISIAFILTPLTFIDPSNMRVVQYFSIYGLIMLPRLSSALSLNFKKAALFIFLVLSLYTVSRNTAYEFFWNDMYVKGMPINDYNY